MVERVDGSTEQFSCLRCTHADVQECISDKDRALAFRTRSVVGGVESTNSLP